MVTFFHPQPGDIPVNDDKGITLAEPGLRPNWLVDSQEDRAVAIAVSNLMQDMQAVTGETQRPINEVDECSPSICIGTVGCSSWIDSAASSGLIDLSPLSKAKDGSRWEGFTLQVAEDGILYIAGVDRRGTIYGIYTLSQAIGVSPLHWWGDVPPRQQERISLPRGLRVFDWPSVKYRGFFINDEEELDNWARQHTEDGTIGPQTYKHVFDLILRLRGNYLWPAMHVNAFNADPRNGQLAQTMGIVIGSSHCDMLLRNNQHEWDPWVKKQSKSVSYDYSIPRQNRDMIKRYWSQSVDANKNYEVTWTLGMRGIHDTGFTTKAIDQDSSLDTTGRKKARVKLLSTVIQDQINILKNHLGSKASVAPKLFIPYKEVLPLYDAGLEVPDDVTIMWVNDNYGYMRRFPNKTERSRKGGNGVYYHNSYWAPPRTSYRCTSSTPLALMQDQLGQCWNKGIRQIWVDNLGAIKRLELEGAYFLHLAWNADEQHRCLAARDFVTQWFKETFASDQGSEAADLCMSYYQINNETKIEHIHEWSFSQTGYGDEAGERLALLRALCERSNALEKKLNPSLRESYCELIGLKIRMCYYVCAQFYHADRSRLNNSSAGLPADNRQMELSHLFERMIQSLVLWYNKVLASGKWDGIFSPGQFPPPTLPQHPACRPAITMSDQGLGLRPNGGDRLFDITQSKQIKLLFDPYGLAEQWIDLYAMGPCEQEIEVYSNRDWIRVKEYQSVIHDEQRIHIIIENAWAHAGQRANLTITTNPSKSDGNKTIGSHKGNIDIMVGTAPHLSRDFTGYVEADGFISMDPTRGQIECDQTGVTSWIPTADLGRFGNDLMQTVGQTDKVRNNSACLSLYFWLKTPGQHYLEIHRLPTLNSRGRKRVLIDLDYKKSMILESPTTDELLGNWQDAIVDNSERLTIPLPHLDAGPHHIGLHVIDESFGIDKIVLYTKPRRPGHLGPCFSAWLSGNGDQSIVREYSKILAFQPAPNRTAFDLPLHRLSRDEFNFDLDKLPEKPLPYFDRFYWQHGGLYTKPRLVWPTKTGSEAQGSLSPLKKQQNRVYLETQGCLNPNDAAWVSSLQESNTGWVHTDAPTHGGKGLAMRAEPTGRICPDPAQAPTINLSFDIKQEGNYTLWLFDQFASDLEDSCYFFLNGILLDPSDLFPRGGRLMTYATEHVWGWSEITQIYLSKRRHTLSLAPHRSGMKIARIYLACDGSEPPLDKDWPQ